MFTKYLGEKMDLLKEDIGYFDLTTKALGITDKMGVMSYAPKQDMLLCGCEYVKNILKQLELEFEFFYNDGTKVKANSKILICKGSADKLHKAWKITQNIFEYMSAIATYTNTLLEAIEHKIPVLTTRKNMPGAKELMQQAVFCGGGAPHRLGTYDSILIFEQHLEFLQDRDELEIAFANLKKRFIEKKISIEVDNFESASYFASLGCDILQCEKMSYDELKMCTNLKQTYKNLVVVATGGINHTNIKEYASCGVDAIVTSSPYHAKPLDVKVVIKELV